MAKPRTTQRVHKVGASYLFELVKQAPHYAFSTNVPSYSADIYAEYLHIDFLGRCLAPARHAGRDVKITILGNRNILVAPHDPNWRPRGVGHLTIRGQRAEYLGSMPYDAAWALIAAVAGGALRYLVLSGEPLHRGSAQIGRMAFDADYDAGDFAE